MRRLIEKYHPSVRAALHRWVDDVASIEFSCEQHRQQTLAAVKRMLEHYPAYAVARAYRVAHPIASGLCFINAPLEKIRKASRIGIGPEVPADRIRVKMGRKYPVMFLANQEADAAIELAAA